MKDKKIISFIICFAFIIQIILPPSIAKAAATPNITYSMSSSVITPGDTFDITVNASNVSSLYAASLDFKYDSSLIDIVSVTNGTLLANAHVTTPINTAGDLSIITTLLGNAQPITGSGSLFKITAKAKKLGTINLNTISTNSALSVTGNNLRLKLSDTNITPISYTAEPRTITIMDSLPPLSAGMYQETNSSIKYTGNWVTWADSSNSGGATKYSNEVGASFQFAFNGTGFKLFGFTNLQKGIAKITVDGKVENNIDTYSVDRVFKNNIFQRTNLPNGTHTVKVEVTGMKNPIAISEVINFDGVEIVSSPNPTTKLVEDTDPSIKYTGTWTNWYHQNHSGGYTKYSNILNNSIEYTFYGSGIRVLGYTNNQKGIGKVIVDGKDYSIDSYTSFGIYKNTLFEISNLTSGKHTIKVVANGTKNPIATDTYINFDAFEVLNPTAALPLSAGLYEESNSNITYTGAWTSWDDPSHSGGGSKYANGVGSSFQFTFTGTGFKILGFTNVQKGLAKITVDGVNENNIDTYTLDRIYKNNIFQRTNLSNGTHTVKVEVTGMKNPAATDVYINFDAIEIIGTQSPPTKLVEDTDQNIKYSGTWTNWYHQSHSGGYTRYSNVPNNSIEYTFYGTGIRILGYTNNQKGIGKVYVDNKEYSIDSYTTNGIHKNTLFEISNLTSGKHTIKVVVTGTKNSIATDNYINFDAFEVINPIQPPQYLTQGYYEETDSNIKYSGNWITWADSGNSGGTTKYSNQVGASFEFTFNGTGFKLFGFTNLQKGIAKITVDGKIENNIDTYSYDRIYKNNIFQRTNLSNGTHTVKIEVTGMRNPIAISEVINFDGLEIISSPNPSTTLIEDTNTAIKYSGTWTKWYNASHSGGYTRYANKLNDSIQYTFSGTGIRILGYTNNQKGIGKVIVDGKEYSIDSYTTNGIYKNTLYEISNLTKGTHTIKIIVTGTKNPKATDTYVNFDAFEVLN